MHHTKSPRRRLGRLVVAASAISIAVMGAIASPAPAEAQSADGDLQELVEQYAPLLMIKEQSTACDAEGEPYFPIAVDAVLDNSEIALRQVGRGDPVVMWGPEADDLFGLGEGFFVDFPGSALEPDCVFERDNARYNADRAPTIYAHVLHPPDDPDLLVVQYWFYWYFNDWNNKHESDWEGISLLFEANTVDAARAAGPVAVGYSQHEGGERAEWGDSKLERVGDRPLVYSSAGSHASYFDSAIYLGRGASEGFGCDDTTGPSTQIDPAVVLLPDEVTDADDPLAWLAFEGRWGERQSGPFNGPTGPALKERWSDPMPWFDDLRPSGVVIPAGDSDAASLIGVFCAVVEFGSNTLINLSLSPFSVVLTLAIAVVFMRWLAGRTDWSRVPATPLRQRRRAGQIIRASLRVYASAPLVFVVFGLVFLPAVLVSGLVAATLERMPVVGPLIDLAAGASGTNFLVALLIGSFANLAATVFVNAAVADHMRSTESGLPGGLVSLRRTWERRNVLASMFVRSFVIVVGLLITVVGAPWAIRQLVRYQFGPQVIVDDGASGPDALHRSTELVRGNWWHTALFVTVLNVGVGVVATVVGLLLLVGAAGIPLWAFSMILSLVSASVVPLAAIALTMLYGAAAATDEPDPVFEELAVG